VLEVVHNEQEPLLPQVGIESLALSLTFRLSEAQGLRDGRNDERGITQGRQGDEGHAIGEEIRRFPSRL
jgi:hypothetical protein